MISRMCSHCDRMVPETQTYCPSCGHQAHVCRLDCACPKCARARRRASEADAPAPFAPAITEVLTRLRRRADLDDNPADGAAKPEGAVAMSKEPGKVTAPVTRQVKRTPVSADLAAKIRAVDAALEAEFGLDFAFVILARGSLVSASNARDGVVPPITATAVSDEGG